MTGRTGGFLQEKSSSTLISPTVVSLCNELSLLEFLPDYAHSPVLSDIFLKIVVISRRINPIQPTLLEKAMAPYSSTLAWKIPWMEEPGGLQSMGSLESGTTERLHFHFSLSCTGEGNGNPLQCSCLENPRDREAWWAAVYGVAQSRT